MLTKRKATLVGQDQLFYYAGRTYVRAKPEETRKHPGDARVGVLAYHIPEQGDRVPVVVNPLIEVYVSTK